ncbi:MAG: glycosyltransferase family 4 protein [Caldilineaceae bacterium]|nr:glycosyltransferase family 4 protein [Caldilineaceae bacterium]
MQVAINAQLLSQTASYRGAGVSNYSRHLLEAMGEMAQEAPHLALTAYVNVPDFTVEGVQFVRSRLPLQQPLARIVWEQSCFPLALQRQGADVVHGLVNVLPLATATPGIVTVHDLSFIRMQEKLPAAKRWYLTHLCRASVQKATQVIAVSRQTADDLIRYFHVAPHKIAIIYNGVAERFQPHAAATVAEFRRTHQLPARFLLYVGTLEPRKNLPLLLRAYARWRRESADHDVALIVAGGKGWFYGEIFQLVQELGLTAWVHFPGYIPDAELPAWYNAAEGFIYPSLFEGFGLPVLEAMACGTPVICSDIPVLREVAGESALTFDREDERALAAQIAALLTEADLRRELIEKGRAQAHQFSWKASAQTTLALYQGL